MVSSVSPELAHRLVSSELKTPAVFKNMLQSWQCKDWTLTNWADSLKNQKLKFRIGSRSNERPSPLWEGECYFTEATLQEFQAWVENSSVVDKSNPFHGFNEHEHWCYADYKYMAELYKDDLNKFKILDWNNFGFSGRNAYQSTLWIGSNGAFTPCHYDTYGYNLVAQLIGKKRWILFPPSQTNLMQPSRIPYEESSVFSEINIQNPQLNEYPAFAHTTPFVVTLQPGDVLFVPYHWWHFVESMETSVSVNTWLEIKKDDASRLEEAIARTLISTFIEVFGTDEWINPTEKIELPEVNITYVHEACMTCVVSSENMLNKNILHKENPSGKLIGMEVPENSASQCSKIINHHGPVSKRHRSSDEVQERLLSHNECVIPVRQLSFSEFTNLMGIPVTKKNSIQNITPLDLRMTEKCFVKETANSNTTDRCNLDQVTQSPDDVNKKNLYEEASASNQNIIKDIADTDNKKFKKLLMNSILHPHIVSEIATLLQKGCKI